MSQPKLGMRVASDIDCERLLPATINAEALAAMDQGYEVVFFVDETLDQITLGKLINTIDSTYTTFAISRNHDGDVSLTFDPNWRECAKEESLTEADLADIKAGTFGKKN